MRKLKKSLFFLPLIVTLLFLPGTASATGYLIIQATGAVQGVIAGDSTLRQNWIDVYAFSHGVSVPIGANGLPSGPAQTSELSISTEFDRSTVKLFKAQATQETFTTFTLEYVDVAKMPMTLIRYELIDAHLINAQESGGSGYGLPSVSLGLSYSRINITDLVEGTTVSYDWNAAPAAAPEILAKGILLAPTPNPTHGRTEFRFALPSDSNAQLSLFDLRGHLVRELYHGWTSTEPTVATWDGTDDRGMRVAQGMYVARLTYPGREVTQRITVLR